MEITANEIRQMDYVSFMGLLNETNRPPGGKDSMRRMVQNAFLTENSHVLHAGCNTGFCSFEIVHLVKCKVTAIDINPHMIASAIEKKNREPSPFRNLLYFQLSDAQQLPFEDNTFDLVMSGGSTAFMKDKDAAVREYVRVCKPYGFVGDTCLFYIDSPPKVLIDEINRLLNIEIQIWDEDYWLSLYKNAGLEIYYKHTDRMPSKPTDDDVLEYSRSMIDRLSFKGEAKDAAVKKFHSYMRLFNENHKYLGYNVLLCRKRPETEQITLFGM